MFTLFKKSQVKNKPFLIKNTKNQAQNCQIKVFQVDYFLKKEKNEQSEDEILYFNLDMTGFWFPIWHNSSNPWSVETFFECIVINLETLIIQRWILMWSTIVFNVYIPSSKLENAIEREREREKKKGDIWQIFTNEMHFHQWVTSQYKRLD